jgi:hypothetical protein
VRRILLKVLYWLAVLIVSLAVLIALVLFLESRDASRIEDDARVPAALASADVPGQELGAMQLGGAPTSA